MGVTMPSIFPFIMGRNNKVAWSFTYGFMDQVDYFIEEVKDGKVRRRGEEWEDLTPREEVIKRKGEEDLVLTFYETDLGVLEIADSTSSSPPSDGLYLSRQWVNGKGGIADSMKSMRELMDVKDAREGGDILAWSTISLNGVLVDDTGRVLYQQAGSLPSRQRNASGLAVLLGWEESHQWTSGDRVSPKELARYEKEEGFIVTANNGVNPDK